MKGKQENKMPCEKKISKCYNCHRVKKMSRDKCKMVQKQKKNIKET